MAKTCCCGSKTTHRTDEERKKLIHRLNRIEGQIRGLRGMIEADAYCTDVLTQSAAAAAALSGFNKELISLHMKGCVTRDILAGDEKSVEELLAILQKLMR